MKINAKWIWLGQREKYPYNQTIIAVKNFKLGKFKSAKIKITADSFYRLFINGQWVNDGPARSWPNHYQVDVIDISSYLETGDNEIKVIAKFDGIGTFKNVALQAGLLAEIEVVLSTGKKFSIGTDKTWKVALAKNWIPNTPKIAVQRSPAELYDARSEDNLKFVPAKVICDSIEGPNKGFMPRAVAFMTKTPFAFKAFKEANIIGRSSDIDVCVCMPRLVLPGVVSANMHMHYPFGMATIITVDKKCKLKIKSQAWRTDHFKVSIDGKYKKNGIFELTPGRHFVLAFVRCTFLHDKDVSMTFSCGEKLKFENPIKKGYENPWSYISFDEFAFVGDDIVWINWFDRNPDARKKVDEYIELTDGLIKKIKDKRTFVKHLSSRTKLISNEKMFVEDDYLKFRDRKVLDCGDDNVINPGGLIYDNGEMTIVKPSKQGDVELVYDLGEQNCGYWDFELITQAGTIVDIYEVEYIKKDGDIQHTLENRNGFRYIAKEGVNKFTSLHRRSGRYVFVTLRNFDKPVNIRKVQLIEATYPVNQVGSFKCSDEMLNRIWDISARSMKLCMEDVFVDCPAYEQTLWIGDARNEALFGYYSFGAVDIAQNSLRLGAESLEVMPMVGCQVPSSWYSIIPVWSFLWSIAVWENYWFSGDEKFLKRMWKYVKKNLKNAQKYIDYDGLFSDDMWNLFDWADIDYCHDKVIHNTMFMVGAVDAAIKCGEVLKDTKAVAWLGGLRSDLKKAVNKTWDQNRKSYPDSFLEDGSVSKSICQHTSFLSILYDIVPKKYYADVVNNMVKPRKSMVKVGSPFAILYLYEAMEKAGFEKEIIEQIYKNYIPMLEDDATTTWEVFGDSPLSPQGGRYPTRSHCHGWSAAPIYFLPRIVLGIKQTKVGGVEFEISPLLCGLKDASGGVATAKGTLNLRWEIAGETLKVDYSAPKGVKVKFKHNASHKGLKVMLNSRNFK